MEEIFKKIEALLNAFYPVLYLTSFEYERTKQKVRTVVGDITPQNHIYEWNCIDGLCLIQKGSRNQIENMEEPEEVLKYILSVSDRSHKDVFMLEDFNYYIEEPRIKHLLRIIADGCYPSFYLLDNMDNPNTSFGVLRSSKYFNAYLIKNDDEHKTSYVTDSYDYIASNEPDVYDSDPNSSIKKVNVGEFSCLSFNVIYNANLTEKDKKKIAIYAEFEKINSGKYVFNVDDR